MPKPDGDQSLVYTKAVKKIARRKIASTGHGKASEIALLEAVLLKLAQLGLNGDIKALALFLSMVEKAERSSLDGSMVETFNINVFGGLPDN